MFINLLLFEPCFEWDFIIVFSPWVWGWGVCGELRDESIGRPRKVLKLLCIETLSKTLVVACQSDSLEGMTCHCVRHCYIIIILKTFLSYCFFLPCFLYSFWRHSFFFLSSLFLISYINFNQILWSSIPYRSLNLWCLKFLFKQGVLVFTSLLNQLWKHLLKEKSSGKTFRKHLSMKCQMFPH